MQSVVVRPTGLPVGEFGGRVITASRPVTTWGARFFKPWRPPFELYGLESVNHRQKEFRGERHRRAPPIRATEYTLAGMDHHSGAAEGAVPRDESLPGRCIPGTDRSFLASVRF